MTTTTDRPTITETEARAIAVDWHGGQASDLYAFASSGHRGGGLRAAVHDELADAALDAAQAEPDSSARDRAIENAVELETLAEYLDRTVTREQAMHELAEDYAPQPQWEIADASDPARFALIEESRYGGHWLTFHESNAAAAAYVRGQEYPEDWQTVGLVDLDAPRRHDAEFDLIAVATDSDALDDITQAMRDRWRRLDETGDNNEQDTLAEIAAMILATGRTIDPTPVKGH